MVAAKPHLTCGRWDGTTLVLPVRVQPRAKRLTLGSILQDRVRLSLTAPPVDGKANAQAREVLAEAFGVSLSRVTLVQGESSRDKVFRIDDPQYFPPVLLSASLPGAGL
jgi:hypothetical protein